jgi:hypothetical protein
MFEDFGIGKKTNDGGIIFGGASNSMSSGNKTDSTNGGYDYWIVKTDAAGVIQWDKDFGGSWGEAGLYDIIETYDNGFLLSGLSRSNIGGDKTENNLGVVQNWIVKTDAQGNKLWDKTILSGGDNSFAFASFAVQTDESCYVLANNTSSGIAGYKSEPNWDVNDSLYDQWIVKFCDTLHTQLSVKTEEPIHLMIAPNPIKDYVSLESEFEIVQVKIIDLFGRIVFKQNNDCKFLDLSTIEPGVYNIELQFENAILVKKIIKAQ